MLDSMKANGRRVGQTTFKRGRAAAEKMNKAVKAPEKAGMAGGLIGGASALSFTHLGGFGVVAGGTGIGVAGLTGAAIATGGVALAGFGGAYVAYKAGQWVIESRFGNDGSGQDNGTSDPDGSPSGGGPSGPDLAGAPVGAFPRTPLGDIGALTESRRFVREYVLAVRRASSGFPLSRE